MGNVASGGNHELSEMGPQRGIQALREAIRNREVTFPAQVPVFERVHRKDIQWRLVLLYFVLGWSAVRIAERYGVSTAQVYKLISQWTHRAVTLGYVARIPLEEALSCRVESSDPRVNLIFEACH